MSRSRADSLPHWEKLRPVGDCKCRGSWPGHSLFSRARPLRCPPFQVTLLCHGRPLPSPGRGALGTWCTCVCARESCAEGRGPRAPEVTADALAAQRPFRQAPPRPPCNPTSRVCVPLQVQPVLHTVCEVRPAACRAVASVLGMAPCPPRACVWGVLAEAACVLPLLRSCETGRQVSCT